MVPASDPSTWRQDDQNFKGTLGYISLTPVCTAWDLVRKRDGWGGGEGRRKIRGGRKEERKGGSQQRGLCYIFCSPGRLLKEYRSKGLLSIFVNSAGLAIPHAHPSVDS